MVYPTLLPLLPLMHTPWLPVVDWTDPHHRFKWTSPFRQKTKSGFCASAITFQTQSTTNQRSIPFGYLLQLLVQSHQCPLPCFLEFRSWRSWWSRRQGFRRHHNGWFTNDLVSLSENVPKICLFHWWSFFLTKSKTPSLGNTLLRSCFIRTSVLSDVR